MSTPNFQFKQFTVWHDRCGMKVNTDGVLLGAWSPVDDVASKKNQESIRVLDIGTGSGLIALMLAQRCTNASIDAIDIMPEAVSQADSNFHLSPWSNRLHAIDSSIQNWRPDYTYDLIVSNPPFFVNSLLNPDEARRAARHTDTLPFSDLICNATRLLSDDGIFALIIPTETADEIIPIARMHGLFRSHITQVRTTPSKPVKRILTSFSKKEESVICDELCLMSATAPRSEEYIALTKDFYL